MHIARDVNRAIYRTMSANSPPPSAPLGTNAGKSWQKADLFFLKAALARGMSSVEAAGFLARGEDEVQQKARELRAHFTWRARRGRLHAGTGRPRQPIVTR